MQRRMVTVMVVTVLVALGGADDPAEAQRPMPATCDAELDAAFEQWADAGFSGTVAMTTGGEVDCVAAYGRADEEAGRANTPDTVFSMGSVTKGFTAAAVFRLVDDGRLAVTDRAGDLLAGLRGPAADVTVDQLLLHTSGLAGSIGADHEPLSRAEAIAALGDLELAFPPGTGFLYSNAGYSLLALIVEDVSGSTYRDFTAERVLTLPDGHVAGGFWDGEPAAPGPRAVGYLDDGPTDEMGGFAGPHWALDGNGSLAMTVPDLAAWTRVLFTGQLLSPASTAEIARPGYDHGNDAAETPGWVRLDATVLGEPVYSTAGGGGDVGHNAVVAWLPESERVVAIASNTDGVTAEALLDAIGPALAAGSPLPGPAFEPVAATPEELAVHAGTYELDGGNSYEVRIDGDRLAVEVRGPRAVAALFPRPDGADEHEARVTALLAGETPAGRQELDALGAVLGTVESVDVLGTIAQDGEQRTYVVVAGDGSTILAWYSVDAAGGVQAAELDTDPPTIRLAPLGDGTFRPDDPTGEGADVDIDLDGNTMTVTAPTGSVVAHRTR